MRIYTSIPPSSARARSTHEERMLCGSPSPTFMQTEAAGGGGRSHRGGRGSFRSPRKPPALSSVSKASPTLHRFLSVLIAAALVGSKPPPPGAGRIYSCSNSGQTPPRLVLGEFEELQIHSFGDRWEQVVPLCSPCAVLEGEMMEINHL